MRNPPKAGSSKLVKSETSRRHLVASVHVHMQTGRYAEPSLPSAPFAVLVTPESGEYRADLATFDRRSVSKTLADLVRGRVFKLNPLPSSQDQISLIGGLSKVSHRAKQQNSSCPARYNTMWTKIEATFLFRILALGLFGLLSPEGLERLLLGSMEASKSMLLGPQPPLLWQQMLYRVFRLLNNNTARLLP